MKTIALIIAILIAICTAGCASVNQAYSAAGASALVDARTASDNALKTAITAICFTPYDTIARNPTVVPGVMALCLPGGNIANPANALNAVQKP